MPYAVVAPLHWYGPTVAATIPSAVAEVQLSAKLQKRANVDDISSAESQIKLTNGRGSPLSVVAPAAVECLLKKRLTNRLNVSIGATPSAFDVAQTVWYGTSLDGFSMHKVMEVLMAIAAGKTIIDASGANPIVTFRNPADTADRVTATMTGSERTTVDIT